MKTWEKPKLIILVRGRPEERILAACKTMSGAGGSPQVIDWQCDDPAEYCDIECNTIASS